MTDPKDHTGPASPEDPRVLALIRQMADAENKLRALLGDSVDLVLDPATGAPIFFRETQQALLRAQEELREANVRLEQRVEARTAELQASEERLRLLVETMPQGVVYQNADGHISTMNPAAERILGKSPTELLGETSESTEHDTVRADGTPFPGSEHPAMMALHTGQIVSQVVMGVFNPRLQAYRWISVDAIPLFRPGGTTPYQVYTVFEDITDRKETEAERERLLDALANRTSEMEATLSCIADGLVLFDSTGAITYINPAAKHLFRSLADQDIRRWHEITSLLKIETTDGKPFPVDALPLARVAHGEQVSGVVMVLHPPDQPVLWISASAAPIRTEEGEMLGAVLSFTDVTALHTLQEQMRIMLQVVSHDLRSPISVIHGHIDLLQSYLTAQGIDGECQTSIDAIARSEQRMNTMIEDLVDVTRFEGGQLHLKRQPVALPAFLTDLLARLETVMDMRRVVLELPEALPMVFADYDRLDRMMTNLLSNALKYSDGPVRITAVAEDGMVRVAVTDQGRGIDPEDLPHLFDRFYRARGARKAEGIGLGLYITRLLVEAHGGRIEVASMPGAGSTFTFTLPAA